MNDRLNSRVLLEVCIDDMPGLTAALAGGADRIEVCSALPVGGLTPSAGLMRKAAECGVPAVAMIRPRAGGFVFAEDDLDVMLADVARAREVGLAGVVLGAALSDFSLDIEMLLRLRDAAGDLEICLHRVFDLTPDPFEAMDQAIELGFSRILTSGQAKSAPEGSALLHDLVRYADDRICILPGGGINTENVAEVVRAVGTSEIHASCSKVKITSSEKLINLGFTPSSGRRMTDPEMVGEMRRMLALIAATEMHFDPSETGDNKSVEAAQ